MKHARPVPSAMRALPPLLLFSLALLAPAPSAAEPCVSTKDAGGVCVTPDPACPQARYKPPFQDFAAGGGHCLAVTPTATGQDACSHLRAGTYARPTVREYDGTLCVSAYREGGVGCVVATYEGNLLGVEGRPLCALP